MNTVDPIKNTAHINRIKNALHGRNKLLWIVGINSGLRISDILALKVGDLRGQDNITITEGKTKKRKRFPLNAAIKKAVKECVPAEVSADEYVFKSRKGVNKPIGRVQAYTVLNDAVERAGLTDKVGKIGTHTMRKTFGAKAYENGTDLAMLMRIFNHSSQNETLKYIGIQQRDIDEVYANVCL
ncbi:tyrosine-type recombinase/integrase [Salicibibacter cibarius]|uniref:Tyrosine-type recombinase/integrase n=1 Tax=Salicibibacter cibarius TaxID=2743000 RepID=A0A7T6YZJ3_9BACI|nr:tyrosine-type recombinase/integrase [Salicibibacter cibarius]QQK74203.1 tyrosine-type recombinase/integrase [Salicibibacter cibarius]